MAASFLFVDAAMMKQSRFSTLPSPRKNDVVLGKVCFVTGQMPSLNETISPIRESDGPLKKEALEYGRVTYALAFSFALVVGALR
jgi:hypothetical protein